MSTSEFLIYFTIIENKLIAISPAFDKKQGFLNLLKYLTSKNLVTNDLLNDLHNFFQLRNKIVSFPTVELTLAPETIGKIQKVKQALKI